MPFVKKATHFKFNKSLIVLLFKYFNWDIILDLNLYFIENEQLFVLKNIFFKQNKFIIYLIRIAGH